MKTCTQCQRALDESQFNKQKHGQGGLRAYCRDCAKADYHAHNPPKPKVSHKGPQVQITCGNCGKVIETVPALADRKKYCSRACATAGKLNKPALSRRKPAAQMRARYAKMRYNGKQVSVHRHLMEVKLGRTLRLDEVVHHINGNKLDNRIENLCVMDAKEHSRLENLGRKHSKKPKQVC